MRVRKPLSQPRIPASLRRVRNGEERKRNSVERPSPASTDPGSTGEAPAEQPAESAEPAGSVVSRRREQLVRESGGPQDEAHYSCSCGYQFTAPVGTAVSCPHCGTLQAW
jgi:hypothetical protein